MECLQTIVSDLEKSVQCSICLELLNKPVTTRCDHNFCRDCINRALKGKVEIPCPLCKKIIRQRSLRKADHLSTIISAVQNVTSKVQEDAGLDSWIVGSLEVNPTVQTSDPVADSTHGITDTSLSLEQSNKTLKNAASPAIAAEELASANCQMTNEMSAKSFVEVEFGNTSEKNDVNYKNSEGNASPAPMKNGKTSQQNSVGPLKTLPRLRKSTRSQTSQYSTTGTGSSSPGTKKVLVNVEVHQALSGSTGINVNSETGSADSTVIENGVTETDVPHLTNHQRDVMTSSKDDAAIISSSQENGAVVMNESSFSITEAAEEDPFEFPVSQPQPKGNDVKAKGKSKKLKPGKPGKSVNGPPGKSAGRGKKVAESVLGAQKMQSKALNSPRAESAEIEAAKKMIEDVEEHHLVTEKTDVPIKTRSRSSKTSPPSRNEPSKPETEENSKTCEKKSVPKRNKEKALAKKEEIKQLKTDSPHLARRLLSTSSSSSDSFKGNTTRSNSLLPICDPLGQQSVTDKVTNWLQNSNSTSAQTSSVSPERRSRNDSFSEDDLISHSQVSVEPLNDKVIILKRRKFTSPVKLDPEMQRTIRNQLWSRENAVFGSGKPRCVYQAKTNRDLSFGLLYPDQNSPDRRGNGCEKYTQKPEKMFKNHKENLRKRPGRKTQKEMMETEEDLFDIPGLSQGVSPFQSPEKILPNAEETDVVEDEEKNQANIFENTSNSLKHIVDEIDNVQKDSTEDYTIEDPSTAEAHDNTKEEGGAAEAAVTESKEEENGNPQALTNENKEQLRAVTTEENDASGACLEKQGDPRLPNVDSHVVSADVGATPTEKEESLDDTTGKSVTSTVNNNQNVTLNQTSTFLPPPKIPPPRSARKSTLATLGDSPTTCRMDTRNSIRDRLDSKQEVNIGLLEFSEPTQNNETQVEALDSATSFTVIEEEIDGSCPESVVETCRLVLQDFAEVAHPEMAEEGEVTEMNESEVNSLQKSEQAEGSITKADEVAEFANDEHEAAQQCRNTDTPIYLDSVVLASSETDLDGDTSPVLWHMSECAVSAEAQVVVTGPDRLSSSPTLDPPDAALSALVSDIEETDYPVNEQSESVQTRTESLVRNSGTEAEAVKQTNSEIGESADCGTSPSMLLSDHSTLQCVTNGWGGTKLRIFKSAAGSDISTKSSEVSKSTLKDSETVSENLDAKSADKTKDTTDAPLLTDDTKKESICVIPNSDPLNLPEKENVRKRKRTGQRFYSDDGTSSMSTRLKRVKHTVSGFNSDPSDGDFARSSLNTAVAEKTPTAVISPSGNIVNVECVRVPRKRGRPRKYPKIAPPDKNIKTDDASNLDLPSKPLARRQTGKRTRRNPASQNNNNNIVLQHLQEAIAKAHESTNDTVWRNWSSESEIYSSKRTHPGKTKLKLNAALNLDQERQNRGKTRNCRSMNRDINISSSCPVQREEYINYSAQIQENTSCNKRESEDDSRAVDEMILSTWPTANDGASSQDCFKLSASFNDIPKHLTEVSVKLLRLESSESEGTNNVQPSPSSLFKHKQSVFTSRVFPNSVVDVEPDVGDLGADEDVPSSPLLFATQNDVELGNEVTGCQITTTASSPRKGKRLDIDLRDLDENHNSTEKPAFCPLTDNDEGVDFHPDDLDVICCSWNEEEIAGSYKELSCHEDISSIEEERFGKDMRESIEHSTSAAFDCALTTVDKYKELLELIHKLDELQTKFTRDDTEVAKTVFEFADLGARLKALIEETLTTVNMKRNRKSSKLSLHQKSQTSKSLVRKSDRIRAKPTTLSPEYFGSQKRATKSPRKKLKRPPATSSQATKEITRSSIASASMQITSNVNSSPMITRGNSRRSLQNSEVPAADDTESDRVLYSDADYGDNIEENVETDLGSQQDAQIFETESRLNGSSLDGSAQPTGERGGQGLDECGLSPVELDYDEKSLIIDEEESVKELDDRNVNKETERQSESTTVMQALPTTLQANGTVSRKETETNEIVAKVDHWLNRLSDLNEEEAKKQREKLGNIWKDKTPRRNFWKEPGMREIEDAQTTTIENQYRDPWRTPSQRSARQPLWSCANSLNEPLNLVVPKKSTEDPITDSLQPLNLVREDKIKTPQRRVGLQARTAPSPSFTSPSVHSSGGRYKEPLDIMMPQCTPKGRNRLWRRSSQMQDDLQSRTRVTTISNTSNIPLRKGADRLAAKSSPQTRTKEANFSQMQTRKTTNKSHQSSVSPKVRQWLDASVPNAGTVPVTRRSPQEVKPGKMGIIATGLQEKELRYVKVFAKKHDAEFFSAFNKEKVTHVIVKSKNKATCDRTLKYLQGIAGKKWVVGLKWVIDSLVQKTIVREEEYEILGDNCMKEIELEGTGTAPCGPRRSRTSGPDYKHMHGFRCVCLPPFGVISIESIEEILQMCGATVVGNLGSLISPGVETDKMQNVIIIDNEGITTPPDYAALSEQFSATTVMVEWVYECISRFEVQPFDEFVITESTQENSTFG